MSILRLPPQTTGRDFVCGDIHGSFSCVERFLKEINFDPSHDRFICAGDIIDRGPQSEMCLRLLSRPWFFSVRGNHEQLMIDYFSSASASNRWRSAGGNWGVVYKNNLTPIGREITALVHTKLLNLPLLITVDQPDGSRFHVLHAELVSLKELSDDTLSDWGKFKEVCSRSNADGLGILWSRRIFQNLAYEDLSHEMLQEFLDTAQRQGLHNHLGQNLSPIYSGHTVIQRPINFCGQANLDTCAYGSYSKVQPGGGSSAAPDWCGLTVVEPRSGNYWFVNDREFKKITPIIVTKDSAGKLIYHDGKMS